MSTVTEAPVEYQDSGFSVDGIAKIGKSLVHKLGAIVIFLILWELASDFGWVNSIFIPAPTIVLNKGIALILSGELLNHLGISLFRALAGFGLALAVALPLGFLLGGWFKSFEEAINPLLGVLSQLNPWTIMPVFIILLGLGEESKIAIIFLICVWPILFNTVTGIKNVDPALVKMARSVGLSKFQMFYKVLLPASLPVVFVGVRFSAVFAFFMLIGAEMLGAKSGLGFMMLQAQGTFQIPKMYVGIVTVAILGIVINYLMVRIEKRISRGKEEIAI